MNHNRSISPTKQKSMNPLTDAARPVKKLKVDEEENNPSSSLSSSSSSSSDSSSSSSTTEVVNMDISPPPIGSTIRDNSFLNDVLMSAEFPIGPPPSPYYTQNIGLDTPLPVIHTAFDNRLMDEEDEEEEIEQNETESQDMQIDNNDLNEYSSSEVYYSSEDMQDTQEMDMSAIEDSPPMLGSCVIL